MMMKFGLRIFDNHQFAFSRKLSVSVEWDALKRKDAFSVLKRFISVQLRTVEIVHSTRMFILNEGEAAMKLH